MYRRRVNAILIRKKLNIFWGKESVVWPAMACRISLESLYLKQTCDGPSIKLICFSFACSPKVLYTFSYFSKSCSFFPPEEKSAPFWKKKFFLFFRIFVLFWHFRQILNSVRAIPFWNNMTDWSHEESIRIFLSQWATKTTQKTQNCKSVPVFRHQCVNRKYFWFINKLALFCEWSSKLGLSDLHFFCFHFKSSKPKKYQCDVRYTLKFGNIVICFMFHAE
jgi:hypothetical protein